MKEIAMENIRNIGLFGHGGVGKTSLAEAIIYTAGMTNRMGKTEDGTTVSDYTEEEIARQLSISSALLYAEWMHLITKSLYKLLESQVPAILDYHFMESKIGIYCLFRVFRKDGFHLLEKACHFLSSSSSSCIRFTERRAASPSSTILIS